MERWFYSEEGQRRGPVTRNEIQSLLESREICSATLVWSDGMTEWKIADTVFPGAFSPYAPPVYEAEAPAVEWSSYTPSGSQIRPWVRYWARTFDFILFAFVAGVAAVLIWPEFLEMHDTLSGIILLAGYNFVEPFMLAVFGTTPFKALFRIRVRNSDGTKLSYFRGLRRMFSICLRGQGLGIPLLALIMGVSSYSRLTRNHITSWDENGGFTVTHREVAWWRWMLVLLIFVGVVALILQGNAE